ncbi:MAG TPA: division/cell wall cluster transcriptional repressor MraZ [Stellaceae bacterium]|nr:division/cell wall cluster transcriptional repressor MraZ [Stellaceae bacterium]
MPWQDGAPAGRHGQGFGGSALALFLSTFVNKVDRKGRVSVPAPFRLALTGQNFNGIIAYPSFKLPALEASGIDRMEEVSDRIDQLAEFSEDRDALSSILADAEPLAFDGEGRIVLPEPLCRHAGIAETAAFVGRGRTFQIWEPQRFQTHQQEMRDRARRQGATLPPIRADRPLPETPR